MAPLLEAGFSPLVDGTSTTSSRPTLTGKLESLLPNVKRVESPNAPTSCMNRTRRVFNQVVQPSSAAMRLSPA